MTAADGTGEDRRESTRRELTGLLVAVSQLQVQVETLKVAVSQCALHIQVEVVKAEITRIRDAQDRAVDAARSLRNAIIGGATVTLLVNAVAAYVLTH